MMQSVHAVDDVYGGSLVTLTDTADTPNGAWCWFQDERVIIDRDHPNGPTLILTAISDDPDPASFEWGDTDLHWYNIAADTQGDFELHDRMQGDDHNSASLYLRPDGRYVAIYSKHGSDQLTRWRISTNPHDPTAWGPEQTYHNNASQGTTYNNTYYLPNDNHGAGRLYNFPRNHNYDPNVQVSYDQGSTWERVGKLLTEGGNSDRPYVRYASDGTKIHFITTEVHPNTLQTSIYHGYVKDGQLFNSHGDVMDADLFDATGVAPSTLTPVFRNGTPFGGTTMNRAWTVCIEIDTTGNPVAIIQARANDNIADHRFLYARHDGVQWQVNELAKAGGLIASSTQYTGLVSIDPDNPTVVYMSSDLDPGTGVATGSGRYEVFKGVTSDFGQTWAWSPITEHSTMDNVRPMVPDWDGKNTALTWMRGTYTFWKDWNTDVVLLILPATDAKSLLFNGDLSGTWDIETTSNFDSGSGTPDDFSHGDEVAFDDTASTFNVHIASPVSPMAVAFNNATGTFSFTGQAMTGPGSLRVIGGGTVNLNNAANTYTGTTRVVDGTLALTGNATIADTPLIDIAGNGTLDVSALNSTFTLSGGQTLRNDSAVVGDVGAGRGSAVTGEGTFSDHVTLHAGATLQVGYLGAFDGIPVPPVTMGAVTNAESFQSFTPGIVFTNGAATGSPAMPGWTFLDYTATGEVTFTLTNESGNIVLRQTDTDYPLSGAPGARAISPLQSDGYLDTIAVQLRSDELEDYADRVIYFAYEDHDNFSAALLRNMGTAEFYDIEDGVQTGQIPTRKDFGAFAPHTFHDVVLTHDALTGHVTLTIDDNPLFDTTDPRFAGGATGAVGIGSYNDAASFDNLTVITESPPFGRPVELNIGGNLTLHRGSTLELDLHSPTLLDRIILAGALTAGGTLNLTLAADAPPPQRGDRFQIFDFASASGTFDGLDLPELDAGLAWDVSNMYTTGVLAVVTDFESWSLARGLSPGVNDDPLDDPNHDGRPNIVHFAFDTDPLGGAGNGGKQRAWIVADGGQDYLTWTLPVRAGASFAGNPLTSGAIDGILYQLFGAEDLVGSDVPVIERTPVLDDGFSALGDYDGVLGADYEYRSFRLAQPSPTRPAGFLGAYVSDALHGSRERNE